MMPMILEPSLPENFKVLFIVAHPDDIEFGAAGSVASWTDAGATVTYVIVTNGAAGSNDPNIDIHELILTRQKEQLEAAAHVGVTDIRFLGYQDGALQPTLELRRDLTRIIREVKPNRVVIQDPTTILVENLADESGDYINHPDHRAAGEAALYAIFPSAETRPIFPELLAEGLDPHHVQEVYLVMSSTPNIAVDISNHTERKFKSLLAHRSQLDESVRPMVEAWDKVTGAELGVTSAESFRKLRFPR